MYYIIRDGYSVINEKDNIAFYDIKTKRMINVFCIKTMSLYAYPVIFLYSHWYEGSDN